MYIKKATFSWLKKVYLNLFIKGYIILFFTLEVTFPLSPSLFAALIRGVIVNTFSSQPDFGNPGIISNWKSP